MSEGGPHGRPVLLVGRGRAPGAGLVVTVRTEAGELPTDVVHLTASDPGPRLQRSVPSRRWSRARREPSGSSGPPWPWTLAGLALLLGGFEVAPRVGVVPRDSFPPTSAVAVELARLVTTGSYWQALGNTLTGWAIAGLLAVAIGVPLGLLIGASRTGQLLARITIDFLRPIPSVALIPLLVLVFGTRPQLKIVLGAFGGVFPLLFQAMYGVADVDPVARDSARSYGLGRRAVVRWVVLPTCMPFIATGARLSASVILLLVVTGEYIVGVAGIGRAVLDAQSSGAYEQMYAYVVTAGVLGLAINGLLGLAERLVLFWHPSQRSSGSGER